MQIRIYKANEVDNQRFYQIPKSLFNNSLYKGLSLESKVVYAFLRDRMDLSNKNGWVNENGEIYLLFSRESISELLDVSVPTVRKAFQQLVKFKLIVEKRQGLGKSNIIYICHVEQSQENQQTEKTFHSGQKQICSQDRKNLSTNDTNYSETDKVKLNNDNDNGCNSSEVATCCIKPLGYREEINQARKYFDECYSKVYREQYHRHKADQNKYIDERLNWAFSEYYVDVDAMFGMIRAYFNNVDCDHNLMHFVTDGILENRVYEAAVY